MQFDFELVRSRRKTVSIGITRDLKVMVRAPLRMSSEEIGLIIQKHASWIEKHMRRQQERNEWNQRNALTPEEITQMKQKAESLLSQRVAYYSEIMGVRPAGVKITSAVTRWGSCSGKNSLCFSYRLMMLPQKAVDYIVVHELAHIQVKNHSSAFYSEIEKYLPDYKERVALIKNWQRQS